MVPNASDPGSISNLIPSSLHTISVGDTAFVLLCTILVFLMIPGLGLFYQGLARKKYSLSVLMQVMISIPITMIIWIFGGFGLIFGANIGGGFLGDPSLGFAMNNVVNIGNPDLFTGSFVVNLAYAPHVPFLAFWAFQLMFAIITPALMVGAFTERITWGKYIIFLILWQYLIYIPVAHWIWGGGFLAQSGVVDWAGGIVIHETAGFGALVTAAMLGRRKLSRIHKENEPSNLPIMMVGATFLLFGWFGFNAGGAMGISTGTLTSAQGGHAVTAFLNTAIAPSFAVVMWIIFEKWVGKKVSVVGIIAAFVAGLAAITPIAGFAPVWASMIVGAIAGTICYFAVVLINKSKIDDALDVFGVHGVGGMTGALLVGGLALNPDSFSTSGKVVDLTGGYQLGVQVAALLLVGIWSSIFTFLIVMLVTKTPVKWGFKEYQHSFEEDIEEYGQLPKHKISENVKHKKLSIVIKLNNLFQLKQFNILNKINKKPLTRFFSF